MLPVLKTISKQRRLIFCSGHPSFLWNWKPMCFFLVADTLVWSSHCRYSGPRKKKAKTGALKPMEYVNNDFIKVDDDYKYKIIAGLLVDNRIAPQFLLFINCTLLVYIEIIKLRLCKNILNYVILSRTTPLKQSCYNCLILYQKSSPTSQCGDCCEI